MKKDWIKRIALSNVWSAFYFLGLKKERNFFVENLAVMMSSGLGAKESLQSIIDETKSFRFKKIVKFVYDDVDSGFSLSKSLKRYNLLPEHMLALIETGEQTGRLSQNLEIVVLQNEKEALFRSRLRSSVLYAGIIFTLSIVVMVGMAWFVLPRVSEFFKNLNTELPPVTLFIIKTGDVFNQWGYIIVPSFAFVVLLVTYFLFSFPRTKFIGHTILFNLPLLRSLIKQVEISRFGYLLGTMLKSGMTISFALESMKTTTTFGNYKRSFEQMLKEINNGHNFAYIFSKYPKTQILFPSSTRQMIIAGEKSGRLADSFLKIGQMYENKTEATARNLPVILEPILLIFVAIIVATLAFGILMPIYDLSFIIE